MRRGLLLRGRSQPVGNVPRDEPEPAGSFTQSGLDVGELDQRVARLFLFVSDALAEATSALLSGDRAMARGVVSSDRKLDCLYESVEDFAEKELLARPQHSSDQLRLLLLVVQIVPEIERSGDLVQHIAARASQGVGKVLSAGARTLVGRMGQLGVEMWRAAALAYAQRDPGAALSLRAMDDELDDLHVRLTQDLAAGAMSVATAIELGLVARFLERLGDHAVNVTRRLECLTVAA